MSIEDEIRVQQAFMKAHAEYDAEEAERKCRQQEQAHQTLINRQNRAKEREERKKYFREHPEALKELKNKILATAKGCTANQGGNDYDHERNDAAGI